MKKLILGIIILWLALTVNVLGDPLTGQQVLNTGPFDCDCKPVELAWTNPFDYPIKIVGVDIWQGMYFKGRADFWAIVNGPNGLMVWAGWDHYTEPVGPVHTTKWYAPHWFDLGVGEQVTLFTQCNGFKVKSYPSGFKAHTTVSIWWTKS